MKRCWYAHYDGEDDFFGGWIDLERRPEDLEV